MFHHTSSVYSPEGPLQPEGQLLVEADPPLISSGPSSSGILVPTYCLRESLFTRGAPSHILTA